MVMSITPQAVLLRLSWLAFDTSPASQVEWPPVHEIEWECSVLVDITTDVE